MKIILNYSNKAYLQSFFQQITFFKDTLKSIINKIVAF